MLLPLPPEPEYPWFKESDGTAVDGDEAQPAYHHYDPYPPDRCSEPLQLSFGQVKPESLEIQRQHPSYAMKQSPHGVAVIINNSKFLSSHKERRGAEVDERNAIKTFRYLGYHVLAYRNLKQQEMMNVFEWVRTQDHKQFDSFVCCIFSHGTDKGVRGIDGELLDPADVADKMNGTSCPGLSGKPKMFFFQSCRGSRDCRAAVADGDEPPGEGDAGSSSAVVDDGEISIPDDADFFFGYATPLGRKAWRDERNGSWYVTELCRSLCTRGGHVDLYHLVLKVHDIVGREYEVGGKKMAPELVSRLSKDVYFFSPE